MIEIIKKIDNINKQMEMAVLMGGILLMALNNVANAVGRYIMSQSIYFSEELNSFLIIIITFYGLGYVTRQGRHIRMSALYDILPKRTQKIMMILISAVTCIIMFLLAWFAFEYVLKTYHRGRVTPALSVPVYIMYIWIVVGFVTTGLQYLFAVIRNLNTTDDTVYLSFTQADEYEEVEISTGSFDESSDGACEKKSCWKEQPT